MNFKKIMVSAIVATITAGVWAATPQVKNVKAFQQYPWEKRVEISFELTGNIVASDGSGKPPILFISAKDRTTGRVYGDVSSAESFLSGDTGTAPGLHKVIWDIGAQDLVFDSSNVTFVVAYCDDQPYWVVDLSAGADSLSYSGSYLYDVPEGGWTDEYKTTKMVLRRIAPGSFRMCGQYNVTLTKPFYIGIFEVTQKQYHLVTRTKPSCYAGDNRPAENLSWDTIRGKYNWPSIKTVEVASFIGKLRTRTGFDFDLPTEAQWEYACRAGTASDFCNGGNTENDLKQLGRYLGNQSDGKGGYSQHTSVGLYKPNAWGIYDMHGNVAEWCLDIYHDDFDDNVTDPVGPCVGSRRVVRNGHFGCPFENCTSSFRKGDYLRNSDCNVGFRIVMSSSGFYELSKTLHVVFDANGGCLSSDNATRTIVHGSTVGALPEPTREGYDFGNWWTAAKGGTQVTTSTTVTSNMTYYAHWHRKVQLWAGGPYWATTNIGAENPWEDGYYFWWGDTIGYKRENDAWVASDGSLSSFSFDPSNAPTYGKKIIQLQSEWWVTTGNNLVPEYDAAQVHWGGKWRMPTADELFGLINKCYYELTTMNGVQGIVFSGKGDFAANSIFLPCFDSYVGCWSSSTEASVDHGIVLSDYPNISTCLGCAWPHSPGMSVCKRYLWMPIRPVQ